MAQLLGNNKPSNQTLRIISAIIAIPLVVSVIYMGSPYLDAVAIIALFGLIREWSRMSMGYQLYPLGYIQAFLMLAIHYLDYSLSDYYLYTGLSAICFAVLESRNLQKFKNYLLYLSGCLYISWSVFIVIYLVTEGLAPFLLWLLVIIWASDSGAYFVGKNIGGAKLCPIISPNKTWSGFLGGIATSVIVGTATSGYLQELYTTIPQIVGVCIYLSLMSHLGDLLESMVKRHYDVKDSGTLIPGHGGVLDRLDSLLLVSFAAGLLIILGI